MELFLLTIGRLENVKKRMDELIGLSEEFDGIDYEIESENAVYFFSVPKYIKEGIVILKYSAIYELHSMLKYMEGIIVDILEVEDNPDDEKRDLLYVQIEVKE